MTLPLPVTETVKTGDEVWARLKVAVTLLAVVIVTEHVPVPLQPLVQPLNVEPARGVAVSVTWVPEV